MSFEFGQWIERSDSLTEQDAESLCQKAFTQQITLQNYPMDKIYLVLEKASHIWKNPNSQFRKEAQEKLPELTGFSIEMIRLGLEELGNMLNPEGLRQKIKSELREIPLQQGYHFDAPTGRLLQYRPLGTLFHVLSGNVFLVGPGSFLQGLITKNISFLKMSSSETFFMPLFMKSIESVDSDKIVSKSVALLNISSQQPEVLDVFKKSVDGIVVWGGEDAVKAYRSNVPARTRVIVFGPKLSFGFISQLAIEKHGLKSAAQFLSQELSIWDQSACTAPQVCFVESTQRAQEFVQELSIALNEMEAKIPAGPPSPDAAVEIRKLRSIAEIGEARGTMILKEPSDYSLRWTVVYSPELNLEPSPLHRTIRILPFNHLSEIEETLKSYRGYLQTVGIYSHDTEEFLNLSSIFSRFGAQRIFPLGQMSGGAIDDPHDGQYDIPLLLNLNVIRPHRDPKSIEHLDAWDFLSQSERSAVLSEKFRNLIMQARKSTYFSEILKDIEIDSMDDLHKIPLLTREIWESHMIPNNDTLQTRPNDGGYVTRSGGSTGTPKFSYFDKEDWESMNRSAQRMFRLSGFNKNDRLANFMTTGDLYGSFISFNEINFNMGIQSFCFGTSSETETIVQVAKAFKINAAQGVTPTLIKALRAAKLLDPTFTMEKIMYAGQGMSPADKQWLRDELKTKIIVSIIGTTEANQIAYQCPHLEGDLHHLVEDYSYFEILDENNQPCPPGEYGKLIITALHKQNYPIIRYSIGDKAKFIQTPCTCGSTDRLIDYKGRWDDLLSLGCVNISYRDVKESLSSFNISELQIVGRYSKRADHPAGADELIIKIETVDFNDSELADKLQFKLFQFLPKIEHAFNEKFFTLKWEIIQPGALARNPRTGKIKAIIDERHGNV